MFTVCPKCALPLAVTAADLRAGQGYVRCGRCANVFNALLALSEESEPLTIEPHGPGESPATEMEMDKASATASRPALTEPATTAAPPAPPAPWPPSAPALRLVDSPPRPPPPTLPLEAAYDESEVEEFRGTSTFETIVLEGDTFLQTEEMIPEEVMASELADV